MKNISFMLTRQQVLDRTKFLTTRDGWLNAKPGQWLMGVEKGMGLRKGEKAVQLGPILTLAVRRRPLRFFTIGEVVLEGYPDWSVQEFVSHYCRSVKVDDLKTQTNIEFGYPVFLAGGPALLVPSLAGSLARPKLMPRTVYIKDLPGFYPGITQKVIDAWPTEEIKQFFEGRRHERENSE